VTGLLLINQNGILNDVDVRVVEYSTDFQKVRLVLSTDIPTLEEDVADIQAQVVTPIHIIKLRKSSMHINP